MGRMGRVCRADLDARVQALRFGLPGEPLAPSPPCSLSRVLNNLTPLLSWRAQVTPDLEIIWNGRYKRRAQREWPKAQLYHPQSRFSNLTVVNPADLPPDYTPGGNVLSSSFSPREGSPLSPPLTERRLSMEEAPDRQELAPGDAMSEEDIHRLMFFERVWDAPLVYPHAPFWSSSACARVWSQPKPGPSRVWCIDNPSLTPPLLTSPEGLLRPGCQARGLGPPQ